MNDGGRLLSNKLCETELTDASYVNEIVEINEEDITASPNVVLGRAPTIKFKVSEGDIEYIAEAPDPEYHSDLATSGEFDDKPAISKKGS